MLDATTLRPRSAVEIVDASFQLLRGNFLSVLTVYALVVVPAFILEVLPHPLLSLIATALNFITGPLAAAVVALIVSESYLGQPIELGDAIGRVFARIGPVIGVGILQNLALVAPAVVFGAALAIGVAFEGFIPLAVLLIAIMVPAWFVIAAWTIAMIPAVILEGGRALDAWGRSRALARGHVPRIIGVYALTLVIALLAGGAAGTAVYFLATATALSSVVAVSLASTVGMMVGYPILSVASILLYYDLRIRREGFDLQLLAKQVERVPAGV